jgi:hypothetical protein
MNPQMDPQMDLQMDLGRIGGDHASVMGGGLSSLHARVY